MACPLPAGDRATHGLLGFLGPKARAVPYTYHGRQHVQPTRGPNGAYLVVLSAPAGSTKGRKARRGGFKAGPPLYATYSTGRTCAVQSVIELDHPTECALVGYVEPRIQLPTRSQAHTTARIHYTPDLIDDHTPLHVPAIQVTFQAPIAITTTRSFYVIELQRPATTACARALTRANTFSPLTQNQPRNRPRGAHDHDRRPTCDRSRPGRYTGLLVYAIVTSPISAADELTPSAKLSHTVTAATFAIDIARRRPHAVTSRTPAGLDPSELTDAREPTVGIAPRAACSYVTGAV